MRGAAALAVLAALAGVGLVAASGVLISRAALRPADFLSLILLVTTVRALGLGRAALRYAERLVGHAAALQGARTDRLRLYDTLAALGRDLLARERAGDVLARSGADVDARMFHALRVTLPLLALGGVALVLVAVLGALDVALGLIAGTGLALGALVAWRERAAVARLARAQDGESREHAAALLDALAASADGAARLVAPRLEGGETRLARLGRALAALTARVSLGRELAAALTVTAVLWRGAHLVTAGDLSGPLLAAVALATLAAFEVLVPLAAVPAAHAVAQAARDRSAALEALTPAALPPSHPLPAPEGPSPFALRAVHVHRAARPILNGLSLDLPPGSTTALTGPSGGGKTTLLHLLTRDLDPHAGRVTLGDTDLRDLDPAALRARIGLHEQAAPLLDGTVRENLRLGDPGASEARLRALLDDLALSHLPLDAWVGETGTRLSGGERARVSLARALLHRGDTLLLDEPTAHLDPETEDTVLDTIAAERRGRTLLIVTHRPAPLRLAEHVYTLKEGHLHPVSPAPRLPAPRSSATEAQP